MAFQKFADAESYKPVEKELVETTLVDQKTGKITTLAGLKQNEKT